MGNFIFVRILINYKYVRINIHDGTTKIIFVVLFHKSTDTHNLLNVCIKQVQFLQNTQAHVKSTRGHMRKI